MDFTDFLWIKLGAFGVGAFIYGWWRASKGLPLQGPAKPEKEPQAPPDSEVK